MDWLFPDMRPFWDTTRPDMPKALGTFTSCRKESEMTTKKNAATTTATKKETTMTTPTKETTMTETPKKMTKEEKKAAAIAARQKEIDDLKAKYDAPAFDNPINVRSVLRAIYISDTTGKEKAPAAIFISDLDKEFLCWYSNERGWTNNGFMTENQVAECHGTIPEGVEGVILHGPTGVPTTYYNVDDIEWEKGEPVFDDESEAGYKERSKARRDNYKARKEAREQRDLKKAIDSGEHKFPVQIGAMTVFMTMAEIKAMNAA